VSVVVVARPGITTPSVRMAAFLIISLLIIHAVKRKGMDSRTIHGVLQQHSRQTTGTGWGTISTPLLQYEEALSPALTVKIQIKFYYLC
jgi:hypothetical protein